MVNKIQDIIEDIFIRDPAYKSWGNFAPGEEIMDLTVEIGTDEDGLPTITPNGTLYL